MFITTQCEDWVKFNNGELIYRYELEEIFNKIGITHVLDQIMLEQAAMIKIAGVFPFIEEQVEVNLMVENPCLYLKLSTGKELMVSFYDVLKWTGETRKQEIREHINVLYQNNKEYSYMDAMIDIASIYFYDKIRTYLIWNI